MSCGSLYTNDWPPLGHRLAAWGWPVHSARTQCVAAKWRAVVPAPLQDQDDELMEDMDFEDDFDSPAADY